MAFQDFRRGLIVEIGVARQAVGEQTHIRGAARIGVIAESHVASLAGLQRGAKRNQIRNTRANDFGAKNDCDVALVCECGLQCAKLVDYFLRELSFAGRGPANRRGFPARGNAKLDSGDEKDSSYAGGMRTRCSAVTLES